MANPAPVSYSAAETPIAGGRRVWRGLPQGRVWFSYVPDSVGTTWETFFGTWELDNDEQASATYRPENKKGRYEVAYGRRTNLSNRRLFVRFHGSGDGSFCRIGLAPQARFEFEIRNQDASILGLGGEWHVMNSAGGFYEPARTIGAIEHLLTRHPDIDLDDQGLAFSGVSMGGGAAFLVPLVLPEEWRRRIAWVAMNIGGIMPRLKVAKYTAGGAWPPDSGAFTSVWDKVDYQIQMGSDPIARGMHYRGGFSSNDSTFLEGGLNTQIPFINLCEQHRVAGMFTWVKYGHSRTEPGVSFPDPQVMDTAEQDITLDRGHPAFTSSTGNWPLTPEDRMNITDFPRGHYNMGLRWDHAGIVDTAAELIFPIKYVARSGIGGGIPDQPSVITVSVTPRRTRNFEIVDGQTIYWTWDGGVLSGTSVVVGDTVTVDSIPLVSGEAYKDLRFYK